MVTCAYMTGVIDAMQALGAAGCGWNIRYAANESLITRARCRMAHEFLKVPGATHLMWIDADVGFKGTDVVKLVEKQLRHKLDVVCGLYPKKGIFWPGVVDAACKGMSSDVIESAGAKFPFTPRADSLDLDLDGCIAVHDAPTGFMLIPRATLERVIAKEPNDWYLSDSEQDYGQPIYRLFDTLVVETQHGDGSRGKRLLSEDYAFCRKVQACGMRVWVDTTIETQHVGTHFFKGRVADQLERVPVEST